MYLPALDTYVTHASHYIQDPELREQAAEYGLSSLKVALLLGHCPILAEFQLVDSWPLLRELARSAALRRLVVDGHILLSYWKDLPYSTVLLEKLNTAAWIPSGWSVESRELLAAYLREGKYGAGEDTDQSLAVMLEGLLFLDTFRARSTLLRRSADPPIGFYKRLNQLINRTETFSRGNTALPEGFCSRLTSTVQTLHAVELLIPLEMRNARAPWLNLLGSERFNSVDGPTKLAAVNIILFASNSQIAHAVAKGETFATLPLLKVDPASSSGPEPPALDLVFLPVWHQALDGDVLTDGILTTSDLDALASISWDQVARVRADLVQLTGLVAQVRKASTNKGRLVSFLTSHLTAAGLPSAITELVCDAGRRTANEVIKQGAELTASTVGPLGAILHYCGRQIAALVGRRRAMQLSTRAVRAVIAGGERSGLLPP